MATESNLQKIHIFPSVDSYEQNQGSVGEDDVALVPDDGGTVITVEATGGLTVSKNGNTYTIDGSGKINKPDRKTATLSASGWSGNSQTITVNGVITNTSAQDIDISCADKASADAWAAGGVWCSDPTQANRLTFTCTTPPTDNINLNIRLWEVG